MNWNEIFYYVYWLIVIIILYSRSVSLKKQVDALYKHLDWQEKDYNEKISYCYKHMAETFLKQEFEDEDDFNAFLASIVERNRQKKEDREEGNND